jgi:hypothetical protein
MYRSSGISGLIFLVLVQMASPALALSRDTAEPPAGNRPEITRVPPASESIRRELLLQSLAATCVRYPKGIGLAAAVAPGQPFSMPPLLANVTQKLTSVRGAQGWMLPPVLGQAALVLRPDGSCSILVRDMHLDRMDAALTRVFYRLEKMHLKHLENRVCFVGGVPTTTQTYTMVPAIAERIWGHPVVKYNSESAKFSRTWRGFLLNISARRNKEGKYSLVLTTFIGHHVMGRGCPTEH